MTPQEAAAHKFFDGMAEFGLSIELDKETLRYTIYQHGKPKKGEQTFRFLHEATRRIGHYIAYERAKKSLSH